MNFNSFRNQHVAWMACLVLVHLCMVPVALALTRWHFGFQNMLTLENQITWTPVFAAQKILLAILVGLGPGLVFKRTSFWLVGIAVITIGTNLSRASLATYEPPFLQTPCWYCLRDFPYALPSLGVAIALLPMRRLMGTISKQPDGGSVSRFFIRDLILLTTIVAAAAALCRYVISNQRLPNPNFVALSIGGCIMLTGTIGVVLLVLSKHFRWLGFLLLSAAIATSVTRSTTWTPIWFGVVSQAYIWALVILTLATLRRLGFRLRRLT